MLINNNISGSHFFSRASKRRHVGHPHWPAQLPDLPTLAFYSFRTFPKFRSGHVTASTESPDVTATLPFCVKLADGMGSLVGSTIPTILVADLGSVDVPVSNPVVLVVDIKRSDDEHQREHMKRHYDASVPKGGGHTMFPTTFAH